MGKHRASWKRWVREMERKPKEPGGCCLFQMIFVLALTILAGTVIARPTPSRMLSLLWVVLLPLSFVHLVISGVLAL